MKTNMAFVVMGQLALTAFSNGQELRLDPPAGASNNRISYEWAMPSGVRWFVSANQAPAPSRTAMIAVDLSQMPRTELQRAHQSRSRSRRAARFVMRTPLVDWEGYKWRAASSLPDNLALEFSRLYELVSVLEKRVAELEAAR